MQPLPVLQLSRARAVFLALALALTAGFAPAQTVLIGNLGGLPAGSSTTEVNELWLQPDAASQIALGFTTGSTAATVGSLNVSLRVFGLTTPQTFEGGIYSDNGGLPGTELASFNAISIPGDPVGATVYSTSLTAGSYTLAANTPYWVVGHDGGGGLYWIMTAGRPMPTSTEGFTYQGVAESYDTGATWMLSYSQTMVRPAFDLIEGTPVPEPATYAAVGGVLVLGFAIWRRRRAAT